MLVLPCLAQTNDLVGMQPVAENIALGTQDLRVTIARIIQISLGLLGAVAVALVIYGGVLYMTSQGVAEKVEQAKKVLISATIGLAIILTSFAIASFVIIKLMEATGGGGTGVPGGPGPGDDDEDWGETGTCLNPNPEDDNPWLCVKDEDNKGGSGKLITLYGGNVGTTPGELYFTDKNKTNKYPAEIVRCKDSDVAWFAPMADSILGKVKVKVPAGLNLDGNNYYVVADPAGSSPQSTDLKDWGMKERKDRFEFDGTAYTGPNLICFVDDTDGVEGNQLTAASKDQPIRIKGERFFKDAADTTQGTVTFNFQDTKDNGVVSSWTADLIKVTVPATASGTVRVIRGADSEYAEDWLDILCDTGADCGTSCCKRKHGKDVCVAGAECLGGEGADCNDGAAGICTVAEFGCQPGLFCDPAKSCTCQEIGRGAPCSSDVAACVPDDTKCGSELYCSASGSCTCQDLPLITEIDPHKAGPGNFVTISGKGFGSTITASSKVILLGGDASAPPDGKVEGDGDDREAILPANCGENAIWQDDQVIIEIPSDAVTGPIKLVNSDGLTEYTDDADGGYTGDLEIDPAVNYPSLCAALPNAGEFKTSVELRGKNFGAEAQGKALIGGTDFTQGSAWSWGHDAGLDLDVVRDALVPNLEPAKLPVQIKSGEIYSNKINFTVVEQGKSPQIDYIDPTQGTQGQYITIFGSNFGKTAGTVKFKKPDGSYVTADTTFPTACANSYWHDTSIVVKVPDLGSASFATSDVYMQTEDGIPSEPAGERVAFNYCLACAITPGLCLVDPSQGPAATTVDFFGDNFGDFLTGVSKAVFYNGQDSFPLEPNWGNQQIHNAIVPGAATEGPGPVYIVDNDGNVSNKLLFKVADCRDDETICATATTGNLCCERDGVCQTETACYGGGVQMCYYGWSFSTGKVSNAFQPPQVIEDILCEEDTQSPSPFMNSITNCNNSQISARFNMKVSPATLTPQNIIVKECIGDTLGQLTCNNDAWDSAEATVTSINGGTGFIYEPPIDLTPNKWYQVILLSGSSGIRSEYGIWLDGNENGGPDGRPGGNYSWVFQVRQQEDRCVIDENDKVMVTPPHVLLETLTETVDYAAMAMKANCNILNGDEFDWDWYKVYSDLDGTIEDAPVANPNAPGCTKHTCIADISEADLNSDGNTDWQQLATPLKQGKTYVSARAGNKADENNDLVIDLNIPEIYRIYPDNGLMHPDVNAYVDIYGTNFGATQGNSQVLFDDLAAGLAPDCDNVWADDHIKVLVPKSIPVPAESQKTYNGLNIKSGISTNIFYDMEDSSGVVLEDKAGNNDGQIYEATRTNDTFGQALVFNGTSSYVKMSNNYLLRTGSVEMAFKPSGLTVGQKQTLFSVSDGTAANVLALNILPADSDNAAVEVKLTVGGVDHSGKTVIPVVKKNAWNYLAFTYDGINYSFYINGRKFYSFAGSNTEGNFHTNSWVTATIENPNVLLGVQNNGSLTNFYNGLIDNFALYQRVLDEEEVRSHYGLAAGQILLLNFDEIGSQIQDYSANNFTNMSASSPDFRIEDGKYGRGFGNATISVTNNPSFNFKDKFSLEGWFKISSRTARFDIFKTSRITLGNLADCGAGVSGFCLKLYLVDKNVPSTNGYKFAYLPESNILENQWNYFAATFDGDKIGVYLNGVKAEYPADPAVLQSRIYEHTNFDQAVIGNGIVQLDNLAVYNRVLADSEISSRVGANNGANVIVRTSYGEDDSWSDTNELFYHSELVHPFICKLQPNAGPQNTVIKISGDNYGDANTTIFQNTTYDLGSLVSWDYLLTLVRDKVSPWTNKLTQISNPFDQSDVSKIPVLISIDPAAEPFKDDVATNGTRELSEAFADIMTPFGIYNTGDYVVETFNPANPGAGIGQTRQEDTILSNTEYYYLPPVITSITPDNGPVRQWVTIKGYNFGNVPGQVFFFNNQVAAFPPAPCEGYWTNTQIVVEVPAAAKAGDVYLVNIYGLSSNEVTYEVNNKPLGPGLCQLSPNVSSIGQRISLKGVRFEGSQGSSKVIFSENKPVLSYDTWTDRNLQVVVPNETEPGDVIVTKKLVTGQRCVGFKIGSWCPSNNYETLYEDVPSNPLYFNLIPQCGEKNGVTLIKTAIKSSEFQGLASGYPRATDYGANIDVALVASDGTYLYTKANMSPAYFNVNRDNIYKIGTGENETEAGHVYNVFTPKTLEDSRIANRNSMTFHSNGKLYVGYYKRTAGKHYIYYIEFLNDGSNNYVAHQEEISDSLMSWGNSNHPDPAVLENEVTEMNITSNGQYIFNIAGLPSADSLSPPGYKVKVFDPEDNWKKITEFEIKNTDRFFAVAPVNSMVAGDIVYMMGSTGSRAMAFNWRDHEWIGQWWPTISVAEKSGQYDWVNNAFWTGEYTNPSKYYRIYRYNGCPFGGCTSDADCQRCGEGNSQCVNGVCTPYISKFDPAQGPIGDWVNIYGCYFGCKRGKVFFQGPDGANDLNEALYLYDLDTECGDDWQCQADPTSICDLNNGAGCDLIKVEVPNRFTPETMDDAVTGPITVKTNYPVFQKKSADDFFVTNAPLGHRICNLIPDYGTRGVNFRIHGELFGENSGSGAGDRIYFGLGDGLNAREPWQDLDGSGDWNGDEQFIDFNGNSSYDASLPNNDYSFNITSYVGGTKVGGKVCPADGWGEKDICVNVPKDVINLSGNTASAGGQGNENNQAVNNVKVVKSDIGSTPYHFTVKFDLCGNQVIDSTAGELCDDSIYPNLTNEELFAICQDLFPGRPDEVLAACYMSCDISCDLSFCLNPDECFDINTLCGNNVLDNYPEIGYSEECDDGNTISGDLCSATCKNEGPGVLCGNNNIDPGEQCDDGNTINGDGCSATCQDENPDEARPYVESTSPEHNSQAMCRNAIIQVVFNQVPTSQLNQHVTEASVTWDNFKLQYCSDGANITQEKKGLWQRVVSYFKNIVNKLLGRQRQAVAAIGCSQFTDMSQDQYELELVRIDRRSRVSIITKELLDPHQIYRVRVSKNVQNALGNYLDATNTPIVNAEGDYIFEFATLGQAGAGSEKTGICKVDNIDVQVYRTRYAEALDNAADLEIVQQREAEYWSSDLFICAGRSDCRLVYDYDQDFAKGSNQHIYRAEGKYSGGLTLKANFKWERTEAFDPKKVISIYAYGGVDTDSNANVVANDSGWVYTTAAGVKEAVAQLVISAQAEGDDSDPTVKNFPIYILLCENPWPSLTENKFPISSIINAYNYQLYYCRDAGKAGDTSDDLPAARWLFPDVSNLTVINNTDFEGGNLDAWSKIQGLAFDSQPLYSRTTLDNRQGYYWINTSKSYSGGVISNKGNGDTGILQSPVFAIEGNQLKFLLGGEAGNKGAIDSFTAVDAPASGAVGVVLAIKEDPAATPEIVLRQQVNGSTLMEEKTFDTSALMTGRPCTADANCNGYGTCKCDGVCSVTNSGQCSLIAGIIYVYDNDTGGYVVFDNLRQYKDGVRIPMR